MAIGSTSFFSQLGPGITTRRSARWRIISKDVEPEPITMPASKVSAGVAAASRRSATRARERMWSESSSTGLSSGWSPERYTSWVIPASSAAVATMSAIFCSRSTKSPPPPIECTR